MNWEFWIFITGLFLLVFSLVTIRNKLVFFVMPTITILMSILIIIGINTRSLPIEGVPPLEEEYVYEHHKISVEKGEYFIFLWVSKNENNVIYHFKMTDEIKKKLNELRKKNQTKGKGRKTSLKFMKKHGKTFMTTRDKLNKNTGLKNSS